MFFGGLLNTCRMKHTLKKKRVSIPRTESPAFQTPVVTAEMVYTPKAPTQALEGTRGFFKTI